MSDSHVRRRSIMIGETMRSREDTLKTLGGEWDSTPVTPVNDRAVVLLPTQEEDASIISNQPIEGRSKPLTQEEDVSIISNQPTEIRSISTDPRKCDSRVTRRDHLDTQVTI
jgi:hypothetical protein